MRNVIAGRMPRAIRRLADDVDDDATRRSISRQVKGVVVGTLLLAVIFVTATAHAVFLIDQASVDAEGERVRVAAERLMAGGEGVSNKAVRDIAETLQLTAARLAAAGDTATSESFVPLTEEGDKGIAWQPRRLGTETFLRIAPIRVSAAAVLVAGIILILNRLHALARHIDGRRVEARNLAVRDPLTGLSNRLAFNDGIEQHLAAAARGQGRSALLLLDLDDFKAVNDRFGHLAGDRLLQEVAQRLLAHAGSGDAVARLGGDEFAIVRQDTLTRRDLTDFAEGLVGLISAPYRIEGHHASVTVSIGIARIEGTTDAETLVRAADAALYRAKARPGGAYEFEAPAPRQSVARLDQSAA